MILTVALCLITWDEIDGVKHDVPLIDRSQFDQIFCIDGGSTDGTKEYLIEQGITVFDQINRGINQACHEAVSNCTCDAFVFFHPKGTIPVEDSYKFRQLFEQGYELVVASRMIKGGRNEDDDKFLKPRKWFVLGLGLISAILFRREGHYIRDILHGFRGMTVEAWLKSNISNLKVSVDAEMVSRSYKLRLKRIEFPTIETERIGGETHFKAFSTGRQLIRYMIWEFFRKT